MLTSILWHQIMLHLKVEPANITGLGCLAAMLFIYWTILEGYRGQSLGKLVLSIVVVGTLGESIDYRKSALESFGKAFLLPLDCLIGWLRFPGSGQRYSNRISGTIVAYEDDLMGLDGADISQRGKLLRDE